MNKPVVSILIPAYNATAFLPKCIDSILWQSYQNLQVVIVDDGSTDKTLELCQSYAEKDSRVEVYHQKNQGVATTRNYLLEIVKGDYVLFVDADDWIEHDMVAYLVSMATEQDAEMVMCDRVVNDAKPSIRKPEIKILSREEAIKDFLLHEYFVGSLCNKLVKTSLLHNEKFHCGICYGEDALFCWGVLQKVKKVVVSDKQLYHYRMNEESISHQSFGEKKLTGHLTWSIICEQTNKWWPQFTKIVLGTFAREDLYLLQQASMGGYPKDQQIKELQSNVRRNYCYLISRLRHNKQILVMATIIMYWYGFGRVYLSLHHLKTSKND